MSPGVQLEPTGTLVVSGLGSSVDYVPVNGEGTLRVEDSTHATFLGVCVRRLELERASVVLAGGVCGAEFIMSDAGVSWNGGMGAVSGPMFVLEAGSRVALAYSIEVEELGVTEGSQLETVLLRSPNASASGIGTEMVVWSCSANLCVESGAVLSGGAPESEVIDLGIGGSMRWHGPRVLRICDGGSFVSRSAQVFSGAVVLETGSETEAGTVHLGGAPLHWLAEVAISEAAPYSSLTKNAGAVLAASDLRVLRGASIGLFTAAGTMSGSITLDGILRPSGLVLGGSVAASSTGLTEISLDAPTPAITVTGACNLAAGLTIVTRDGPTLTGETWSIIAAGSLSLGDIALPTLPSDLEWDLMQTPTSLSITAVPTGVRCRPSVERLSVATIDGYVGDPILLAAAVSGPVTSMRWHKDGLPLADGGIYAGTATPTLTIASGARVNLARYHLIATAPCGRTASSPIDASVRCGGDFNQDFSVDGDDIIDFFGLWDSGEIAADWNHDGSVDGDDVIGFFERWDAGC